MKMFSLGQTISQSKTATVLAQIPTLLNHVRCRTFTASASHRLHPRREKEAAAQENQQPAPNIEEVVAACNACLETADEDIQHIPCHVPSTTGSRLYQQKHAPEFQTSYVSAPTFFENKTGFPEAVLRTNYMSLRPGQIRFQHLLSSTLNSVCFEQRRGFEVMARKKEYSTKQDSKPEKKEQTVTSLVIKALIRGLGFLAVLISVVAAYVLYKVTANISKPPKPVHTNVHFSDVQGSYEAKQELEDIVSFLRNPEQFTSVGAKLPKGLLLVGPPGVGKTLLARAVAGEANVAFFHAKGSEFEEIFVGSGAQRVHNLFKTAKTMAPCIVFIDEIDSVGRQRANTTIHPYANQTINQLLAEMDGFNPNNGVIVMGATNRREILDSAITRAGRFDVEVKVDIPRFQEREELFGYYLGKPNITMESDVSIEQMARKTAGFTGADIENLVNQAALRVALGNRKAISAADLEFAREKLQMGPAMKHKIEDQKTNRITAYHEAGHALMMLFTKNADPLSKVTIQGRGQSLGHTADLPKEEYSQSKVRLLAQLDVAMGGRVAEELVFGADQVGTGAQADFMTAAKIARGMVEKYGMSDKLGPLSFGELPEPSETTQDLVDSEVKRLLIESYERTKAVLTKHRDDLTLLASALLQYETLDKKEVNDVLKRKMKVDLIMK